MLTQAIIWIGRRFSSVLVMLLLAWGFSSNAQQPGFDQVYDRIWKGAANTDLDAAVAATDSLYKSSSTPIHRMRSLMLLARLYQQKEDLEKSVEYALKIEQIAVESADYTWQARANGYLAGLYRMMELYNKARYYSNNALEIIPKIEDPEQANSTRGLLLQELGFTSMDEEDYEQAILRFKEAGESINKFVKNREFNIMNNERLLADNYRLLARYDTALIHYRKAIALSTYAPLHYVAGFAYKGMAETLIEKGRLAEAKTYLDKAEQIADKSQYLQLKNATYDLSKRYYSLIKDQEKLSNAKEKSNTVTDTLLNKRARVLNSMYNRLDQEGVETEVTGKRKNAAILAASILILSGSIYFIVYGKRQKRELAQVRSILAQLNKKENAAEADPARFPSPVNEEIGVVLPDSVTGEDLVESAQDNPGKRMMPLETERNLLGKLVEFEKSETFLEAGFSLASLAIQLETNTKYLSYLIKKHKGADFNNYVNRLRIDFVVDMLRKDPAWRQHKISAMAAASGFSSHSQFATVFKDCTGVSPSIFIKHLASGLG